MRNKPMKRIVALVLAAFMLMSYIPVMTWAVDTSTDIKAIQRPTGICIVEDYDDYIGETWLESLKLPAEVTVTLADGGTTQAAVTWDTTSLDPRTIGYYYLPGTVTLPVGATNGQNLDVSITIQVRKAVNLFSNPSFEDGVNGWGFGYDRRLDGTPAAVGSKALQLQTSTSSKLFQNTLYNKNCEDLAAKVAAEGAGQYYLSAQVRDYLHQGETQHAESLQTYIQLLSKTDANSTAITVRGETPRVTLSMDEYVTTSGIVTLSGDEKWVRADLYIRSATAFAGQWFMADDMQFIPLRVALKAEPAAVTEVKTQIQSRFVAVNYDRYAGENWKASLGLPETVQVLTDAGDTVNVGVTWNYAGLDVSQLGKYTLTGTLDDSAFTNPKGLTVQQNIYVRKVDNLFSNPSFEDGINNWGFGYDRRPDGTPAAVGSKALQLQTSISSKLFQNTLYNKDYEALAARIAAQGAGQYYLSAQVRDYQHQGETQHTDSLQTYIQLLSKTDANSTSVTVRGETSRVTLSMDEYVTTSGIVTLNGDEKWVRADLYLRSATTFAGQWFMADDMQFIPLNVLIPLGEEPADITEIIDEIPARAVVQDYDKYVGENWKDALGLPAAVQVKTSKGLTASVNVNWDYSPLNLDKTGKYTLVGTLDNSLYPNPNDLYVTQEIYIREYKNLITNSSFENGYSDWRCGWNFKTYLTPAADGKVAIGAQSSEKSRTSMLIFFSTNTEDLAAKVVESGAGQYYLGAQVRDYTESGEVPHKDPLKMYLNVSTQNATSTSMMTKNNTNTVTLNETYQQSGGVFNLDGDETWLRVNAYLTSNIEFSEQWIMADKVELVAVNVIVERSEGAMVEVQTIVPERNIIQNYPDYIGAEYTTADLMFPESVEVSSTEGEIVKVGVKWNYSMLNLTKTGRYTVVGSLEDMKIDNPDGLTVEQVVNVVPYENLISNPSFESYTDYWSFDSNVSSEGGISTPIKDGKLSLKVTVGRLNGFKRNWINSLYVKHTNDVGLRISTNGGGRYYFSGWVHGTASSTDIQADVRLWYMNYANGSKYIAHTGNSVTPSTQGYLQSSAIVEVPDDIYWARLDFYLTGDADALRNSVLYMDHMELIPLNVEVPNMTDVVDCETVADPYVHEGTDADGLDLPDTLQITIKTGQKFKVPVKWDTSTYDPNQVGTQTITGQLQLGNKYKNPRNFAPTATIHVCAKGEDLRQTIYISNDGSEDNDGFSPKTPKKDITKLPSYLAAGYNVKLNKGDIWYLPTESITLTNLHGTEDAPLVIGSYGSGELPTIAFMKKIENSAWKLVDAKRNVYAADVSFFSGQIDGETIHRCFVADETYFHLSRTTYVALKEKEFCSYNETLYVRMPEGEVPRDVEVTPVGSAGIRIQIENVSYLTFENLHIKGGSAVHAVIRMDAPTKYVKFEYISMTHTWYYNIMLEADDEDVHYKPEFSHMYMDTMLNEKEGAVSSYDSHYWNPHTIEGINLRDGVDGAWIHDCHMRNMSHAFVCMETLTADTDARTTGVRNCIVEDNTFEGGNALYARAFIILKALNLSGVNMCHDNIFRRNKCYDMTVSSHLAADNILIYSNLFSYSHTTYNEDGTLFDGKSAQPWGFDSMCYGGGEGSIGSMLINNTFYDVAGAIAVYDATSSSIANNIYANNLVVNWKSDSKGAHGEAGAFADSSVALNYFMNNGVYSHTNATDHFMVDGKIYSAEDVNNAVAGYSNNICADPKFVDVDLTLLGKGVRQDFTLSSESPMRYAGLSLFDSIYANFPAWEYLKAEYTDINGVPYLKESPSIGAWSFPELITGDVAEVKELPALTIRQGASFADLILPSTVNAVNDQGIDVTLLVTWSDANFDSSELGVITLTGELRNGPHTDLNINGKTATIKINIKDKLELLNIITVIEPLTVLYGTSQQEAIAQLPDKLQVKEESGFEEYLPVTWTCMDYKSDVPDVYTFKCELPEDMLTNAREFYVEATVRVMHELGRGVELLINPDFIDGTSSAPWQLGWMASQPGSFRITEDPALLPEGEPAGAIVTVSRRYGSIQQDVTGQMKLMGDGVYLFKMKMRAYDQTIDTSTPVLSVTGTTQVLYSCRAQNNIGVEYVEYYALMDVKKVEEARSIIFHTSTYKSLDDAEDGPRSYIIAGCSLVYLGNTDAEVEATLDSMDLTWNTIMGENGFDTGNVMSDLILPGSIGTASKIKWSSSDESTITNDGKVIMGRVPKEVTMTATITYKGIETVKKFTVTVPRDPNLPAYTGTLTGSQTVNVGDEFKVTISTNSENATAYNAYRFTLSFNTSKLEYVGISDPTVTVEVDGGKLVISDIGTERPIADTITVTFRAKKSGVTEVRLVKVEMDLDPNASLDNLPTMTVKDGAAVIDVQKVEQSDDATEDSGNDNSAVIWIVIGLVAAALITGGVIAIILIKKKKQTPPAES